MNSNDIRKSFLDFFASKKHEVVASAPMVIKNDPTLMFTNAGMNQFKDIFLGNSPVKYSRVADTQKCLRVSGKHNDLEEVGHDTYHHTMFEMLGNWSFGDYFKREAIYWAWEYLTEVVKIDKNSLYVTVFGGHEADGLGKDMEAFDIWRELVPEDRILFGSKKDNFWEMGETGPCGPCSEIHCDIRSDEEKAKVSGADLVNYDNPLVIEIWNLVFMQYNRMANGSLVELPAKHIDTGMGFERLCMILQGTKSNYDTDVFQPTIQYLAQLSGIKYGTNPKADVAMRVIADHLRAISFAIADGQLPSNNKAGYVIRRILRRAVRYGYTFLGFNEPFINKLVPILANQMGGTFTELISQKELIKKVITEEENSFLKTLANGITKFNHYLGTLGESGVEVKADGNSSPANSLQVDGAFAFELFDTYGFPIDLTELIAREQGFIVDMESFEKCLQGQKERSRNAAAKETYDWVELSDIMKHDSTLCYDQTEADIKIVKYRKVKTAKDEYYQLVFNRTPFYAESGGQIGDSGDITSINECIKVENTVKENNLVVHIVRTLPENVMSTFIARIDKKRRNQIASNHSATHLLHAALRQVVGSHVEQKGSMVTDQYLRFDFSTFAKLTDEEIAKVESIVNNKIQENITLSEIRNATPEEANAMGAMALFGEKYGDKVRVITFDKNYSVELCGGTHVEATGRIGLIKIISESATAAGVRRIEAITGNHALKYLNDKITVIDEVKALVKNPVDPIKGLKNMIEENRTLQKEVDALRREKVMAMRETLKNSIIVKDGVNVLIARVDIDALAAKELAYAIKAEVNNAIIIFTGVSNGKPSITIAIEEDTSKSLNINAGQIIRTLAKDINGGGGGQPHFATAGGSNPDGVDIVVAEAKKMFL